MHFRAAGRNPKLKVSYRVPLERLVSTVVKRVLQRAGCSILSRTFMKRMVYLRAYYSNILARYFTAVGVRNIFLVYGPGSPKRSSLSAIVTREP